jgi:hypothetical protein
MLTRAATPHTDAARSDPLLAQTDVPDPSLLGFQQFLSLRAVVASDLFTVILSKHQYDVRRVVLRRVGGEAWC